ncbi:MAG: AMP-binding protein [Betaproteobacteria bacterium]|nr:AMP-binding protein [Betaproteobacteria bacterium]
MNAAAYLLATGQAGAPALECGAERLNYDELRAAVGRAAGAWRARGLEQGERVLVFAPDSIAWIIAYLGTIWAGGVAVGLNSRLFERELTVVLSESGARFIWCNESSRALLERLLANIADPPQLVIEAEWSEHLAAAAAAPAAELPEQATAMWIYTSGTTGAPKAVMHAQRSVIAGADFARDILGLGAQDRIYASSKLFFAYALGNSLCAGLRLGATVVLDGEWPTAERVAEVVERHRPTALFSVPTLYLKMLRAGVAARLRAAGVRHYVSAGEALPAAVRREWREATGVAPVSGYGATETVALMFYCDDDSALLKPCPRLEYRMREGNDGAAPRRLWLRHPSTALGYWQRPEAERDSFADGCFSPGDLFRRRDDGSVAYCGRDDDMLKISGQWVSILDVEQALLAASAGCVEGLAAVGFENAEGLVSIALFVVAAEGHETQAREHLDAGIAALPKLKRPRLVKWVSELPLTATGKLQRGKLKQQYLGGAA